MTIHRSQARSALVGRLLVAALFCASASLFHTSPAEAADPCVGDNVRRCLELHYDSTNGRFRTWAWIIDKAGPPNHAVGIQRVHAGFRMRYDDDGLYGFFDVRDDAQGHLEECDDWGENIRIDFGADFSWVNDAGEVTTEYRHGKASIC